MEGHMTEFNFYIGIVGALVLVTGAFLPDKDVTHPAKSLKNWLFAGGGLMMLTYSLIGYFYGDATIFFSFVQGFALIAALLGIANIGDRWGLILTGGTGVIFLGWSLWLFEDYSTAIFIVGLIGISLGYVQKMGTIRRFAALALGGLALALFSWIVGDKIFLTLNAFYAAFSAYRGYEILRKLK